MNLPIALRLSGAGGSRHITGDVEDWEMRSTAMGGFAAAKVVLHRPLRVRPAEVTELGELTIFDRRTREVLFQGRVEDPARAAGDDGQVYVLTAIGNGPAHAQDRREPLVYVDRRVSQFQQRGNGYNRAGTTAVEDDGASEPPIAAVKAMCPRGVSADPTWKIGLGYWLIRECGQKLARFAYTYVAGRNDANWRVRGVTRTGVASGANTHDSAFVTGSASTSKVVVTDFTDGKDVLELMIERITSTEAPANDSTWAQWTGVVVRAMLKNAAGADITTGYTADTVLASEVVTDLLGRWLTEFNGASAAVTATTFPIEQLTFEDGVTPMEVFEYLVSLEPDFYWMALEKDVNGKAKFVWEQWPTEVRYEATIDDGVDLPGSTTGLYDRVVVRWRDSNGRIRWTTRTQTVDALTDAGLTRSEIIDLGGDLASSANAIQAGDAFLAEHATPPNRGTVTINRPIRDVASGRLVQPWRIRPGTLLRLRGVQPRPDALNATTRNGSTVFRVVAVTYSPGRGATLELDSRPRGQQAMLAEIRRKLSQTRR